MSINPFHLSDYKYLFFDMFYKNNNLYLISPIYIQPFNTDDIHIIVNQKELIVTEKHVKDCAEPVAIYIYAGANAGAGTGAGTVPINVTVTFLNITKTYVLQHHITRQNNEVAVTTLFKDDYALFPVFYDYYKKQGVAHFYMYYNGISSPQIKHLFRVANVTLIDWDVPYWTPKNNYTHHAQPGQMHHALYRYGKDIRQYMMFCDFDEYLHIPHTTLKAYVAQHPLVDTFGFCNKWSKCLDNNQGHSLPRHSLQRNTLPRDSLQRNTLPRDSLPRQFLTTPGIYPYNTRSKNIHKVNAVNTLGIHVAYHYNVAEPVILSKFIMFHFYNWSKPNRENKDCPMILVSIE